MRSHAILVKIKEEATREGGLNNEIGKKVDQSTQNVDKLIDQSDKFINTLGEDGAVYEYRTDYLYRRRPQEIEEEFKRKAEG